MRTKETISSHLYAVIMAGGRGERFWPAGRRNKPKQFLPLVSEKPLIEETVQRLFPLIAPEKVLVITNRDFVEKTRELLPIPAENVIGEPEGRNTAPCVALAAALLKRRDPDSTMILLPADHVISPAKKFQAALLHAAEVAQSGSLVTLGIIPHKPSTGYGYIHAGDFEGNFADVLEFKEKPDRKTAEMFLRDGNYFWNSGIFIWRTDVIEKEFEKYCPELAEKISSWANGADFNRDFAECEKISIDYAIMEKAENVKVGKVDFRWNDIGSWSSLRNQFPVDDDGNVVRGNAVVLDAHDNVIIGDPEMMLGVIGMHDVALIQSGNSVLVCPLSEEQRVKELLAEIKQEKFK